MCLVDFKSPENRFSLLSPKSDGDIDDDVAIALAIEDASQALAGRSNKKSHDSVSATFIRTLKEVPERKG